MYVNKEVVNFNVERSSVFLGIHVYSEIKGSGLKEEIDLDMVTRELTEGYKTPWPGEGKLISSALSLKYFGLKKISCTNWMPTTNVSLLSRDSCDVVFHRCWKTV